MDGSKDDIENKLKFDKKIKNQNLKKKKTKVLALNIIKL
jgi:hypothetical protein